MEPCRAPAMGRKCEKRCSVSVRADAFAQVFLADHLEGRQCEVVLTLKSRIPNGRLGRTAVAWMVQVSGSSRISNLS